MVDYNSEKNIHRRFAVKTPKGYVQRKGSSHFTEAGIDKADLYISEYQAEQSALRHGGKVVDIKVSEAEGLFWL